MNPEWKAKWLAALRSGEYEQATGGLRRKEENAFCCLGVLCDLVEPTAWDGHRFVFGDDSRTGLPPISVQCLVGIAAYHTDHLAALNDRGMSFNQIADYIERTL